jgi:hypothetical protein
MQAHTSPLDSKACYIHPKGLLSLQIRGLQKLRLTITSGSDSIGAVYISAFHENHPNWFSHDDKYAKVQSSVN